MADTSLLQSSMGFGIKEVSDVAFYEVGAVSEVDGELTFHQAPLFILDTLKVSNIENTAEQTDAKGGKGNAPLITWDYGREITISLQDAVLSEKTLSLMFEGEVSNSNVIEINARKYPGTYAVVGKTFARDITGKDSLFTWYVPKAKVNSEITLTMEAEGDPTVFDMNLKVLRAENGTMIKLIRDKMFDVNTYDVSKVFAPGAGDLADTYIARVVDGETPVENALVALKDKSGYSNADGFVYFNAVSVGEGETPKFTVVKDGYNTAIDIDATANDITEITLTKQA